MKRTVKYAICKAHYNIGSTTENGYVVWLANLDDPDHKIRWVDEFEKARLFDSRETADIIVARHQIQHNEEDIMAIVSINFSDTTLF